MISYTIRYQIRHKGRLNTSQEDWQDKESTVVADDDAREAIDAVIDTTREYDFRLTEVKVNGSVTNLSYPNTVAS